MAVVLYSVLAIALLILVVLATIICTADASTKQKEKIDPPVVDLPDIVAPRRRHIPERGIGASL